VTISSRKFVIDARVKFAGHIISANGIFPDPAKVAAIHDYRQPTDLTSLRGFLGLCNQLGSFIPDLAQVMTPLQELLKKEVQWQWLPEQELAFQQTKDILTSKLIIKLFNAKLKTELLADALTLHGLGFSLLQRDTNGSPHLICCGSQSLSQAKTRYTMIELEILAIQWAMSKTHYYLFGLQNFTVIMDHKPLIGIFDKPLAALDNL
jgi:hypothetical protein